MKISVSVVVPIWVPSSRSLLRPLSAVRLRLRVGGLHVMAGDLQIVLCALWKDLDSLGGEEGKGKSIKALSHVR